MNNTIEKLPVCCENNSNDFPASNNLNRNGYSRGFTLIEIMIVIAIIGTLSAIALPNYMKYKYSVKITLAMADIRIIEKQIALFVFDNNGRLPDNLSDLTTMGGPINDPWGNPYRYLKINSGVVAPVAFIVPVARVVPDIPSAPVVPDIPSAPVVPDIPSVPDNPGVIGLSRKNLMDVPVNQDYDLYSMGKDGQTNASFRVPVSYDDVVRAYEGQYVGLVSEL